MEMLCLVYLVSTEMYWLEDAGIQDKNRSQTTTAATTGGC